MSSSRSGTVIVVAIERAWHGLWLALSVVVIGYVLFLLLLLLRTQTFGGICTLLAQPSRVPNVERIRQIMRYDACGAPLDATLDTPVGRPIYERGGRLFGTLTGTTLVLRGTENMYDVWLDSLLRQRAFVDGGRWLRRGEHAGVIAHHRVEVQHREWRVHEGANDLARVVWAQLDGRPVDTICGYSLGAMVVALVAYAQYQHTGRVTRGLLVGNPPVGNAAFARAFEQALPDVVYINHAWDFVAQPLLVPSHWLGYYPAGRRLDDNDYPYVRDGWRTLFPHLSYL